MLAPIVDFSSLSFQGFRPQGFGLRLRVLGLGLKVPYRPEAFQKHPHFYNRPLVLTHITLGRKKDPLYLNIRNPIPQKV